MQNTNRGSETVFHLRIGRFPQGFGPGTPQQWGELLRHRRFTDPTRDRAAGATALDRPALSPHAAGGRVLAGEAMCTGPNWAAGICLLQCSGATSGAPDMRGPIAQRKSAPFTPERSLVRTQLGPQ